MGNANIAKALVLLACAGLDSIGPAQADCFDSAAAYQHVNSTMLRAIAMVENPKCDATIRGNTDGSKDTGCMQINSVHIPELARYKVFPPDLLDRCKNIFIGAWHYKRKILKHGNTWIAVGAYHSETPHLRDKYAARVYKVLQRYGYK